MYVCNTQIFYVSPTPYDTCFSSYTTDVQGCSADTTTLTLLDLVEPNDHIF